MKTRRTTLSGAIAAAALATAETPGLDVNVKAMLVVVSAIAVAALGWHAADCPPNCPGTDGRGRKNPARQWWPTAAALALATGVLACLAITQALHITPLKYIAP